MSLSVEFKPFGLIKIMRSWEVGGLESWELKAGSGRDQKPSKQRDIGRFSAPDHSWQPFCTN
jgi:hypothetical protein